MKQLLRIFSKPAIKELFNTVEFTDEEISLMKYLYVDKINQNWVADELGMSQSTLTNKHNDCINQVINFYEYQKYKKENNEQNCFYKYFKD